MSDSSASEPLALADYDEEFLSTMEKAPGNVSLVSDSSGSEPERASVDSENSVDTYSS